MRIDRILALAILHKAGGEIEGRTRFQKLAFLANKQLEKQGLDPYDFVALDYGPFAKDLFESLEWLEEKGYVEETENRTLGGYERSDYKLTKKGRHVMDQNDPTDGGPTIGQPTKDTESLRTIFEIAGEVVDDYNDMPVSNLIRYVYDEYPEYAENSILN